MRPTIQQLEAFLAVARTSSFRRAAEENFVSQSALSAQIKRLEELLGATLFERDRRRTLLTPEGERAREKAVRVLESLDDLVDSMKVGDDPLTGSVRLGVIPTAAHSVVPQLVRAVAAAHPDARLLIVEQPTATIIKRLQAGELDAAIVDVDVELANLKSQVLFEEALVLAIPADHPLSDHADVSLDEVADLDLLLLEDGHCLSDRIRSFCRPADASTHGDFRASSLITLAHMVASGVGATLLPELASRDFRHIPGLKMVPFRDPAPARRIGMVWRPTDRRTQLFERLGELVESSCNTN